MAHSLTDFKSKLIGGGARPNLFEVEITPGDLPSGIEALDGDTFKYLCKAANLPASNVASIDVPFRGRTLKVAGDREIGPWSITVINDEDFRLRTAFERWANVMSKLDDATGVTNPTSYMADAYVQQLGRGREAFADTNAGGSSSVLRTYKFYDIFPTEVAQIDLSYDTGDTIEEYTVEFQVQYWTAGSAQSSGGATDQAGISIS